MQGLSHSPLKLDYLSGLLCGYFKTLRFRLTTHPNSSAVLDSFERSELQTLAVHAPLSGFLRRTVNAASLRKVSSFFDNKLSTIAALAPRFRTMSFYLKDASWEEIRFRQSRRITGQFICHRLHPSPRYLLALAVGRVSTSSVSDCRDTGSSVSNRGPVASRIGSRQPSQETGSLQEPHASNHDD